MSARFDYIDEFKRMTGQTSGYRIGQVGQLFQNKTANMVASSVLGGIVGYAIGSILNAYVFEDPKIINSLGFITAAFGVPIGIYLSS